MRKGRRRVGLRPTKLVVAREKNLWYPGYLLFGLYRNERLKRVLMVVFRVLSLKQTGYTILLLSVLNRVSFWSGIL